MRTRMVFVRHGESVHKEQGVVGGPRGCRGLTERGQAQAASVAHRLAAEAAAWGDVAVYASTQWPPARWALVRFNFKIV